MYNHIWPSIQTNLVGFLIASYIPKHIIQMTNSRSWEIGNTLQFSLLLHYYKSYTIKWKVTYPQYFSQQVPPLIQEHSFPHIDWHPHGVYCLQDWFFPSAILFHIDGWPADFQEYLNFLVLPLFLSIRDLDGTSWS